MTETMRAAVLDAPGPPEALRIRNLPIPEPRTGWVLIEVKAFGLNRSELHTRLGLAEGVTFPRVLGIEATGVVAAAPGDDRVTVTFTSPAASAEVRLVEYQGILPINAIDVTAATTGSGGTSDMVSPPSEP